MVSEPGRRRPSEIYARASIREVLQAALLGAEHWIRRSGVASDDVETWLSHMWAFLSVSDEKTFAAWYEARPELVEIEASGRLPDNVIDAFAIVGVVREDAERVIFAVTDIVYGHLFGAIRWSLVDESIDALGDALAKYELSLPPADEQSFTVRRDANGLGGGVDWGEPTTEHDVGVLRPTPWTEPR